MSYCILLILFFLSTSVHSQQHVTDIKTDENGEVIGWVFSENKTGSVDTNVLYEGQPSLKLDRTIIAPDEGSFVLRRAPLDFEADVLELRARLKARGTGSWVGVNIMLRQDVADTGIEFSNSAFVSGTDTDWQRVRVSQKVSPRAESIVFGAVLVGPGEAWLSDVELWADGEPLTLSSTSETTNEDSDVYLNNIDSIDIDWSELDESNINDLSAFIQVWGFLKYFHPDVSQRSYDWDQTFIESTQALLTGSDLSGVLTALFEKVGVPDYVENEEAATANNVLVETPSDWFLNNAMYEAEIAANLQTLQANRHTFGESQYAVSDDLYLPSFEIESKLWAAHLEHELRLLTLARIWNVIEYWFPYREKLPTEWHAQLREFTQQTVRADSRFEFKQVLQTLLAQLEDGHAMLSESIFEQGHCYLPFTVRHIDEQIIITRLHTSVPGLDIKIGDQLVAIDDRNFNDMLQHWLPLYSASNDDDRNYRLANDLLSRPCDEPTMLTLGRNDNRQQVELTDYAEAPAERAHSLPGDVVQTLEGNVTYLKVNGVSYDAVDKAIEQARETGKLIIDARGYPSEFIVYYLGSKLTDKSLPFARLAGVDPEFPGRVTIQEFVPTLHPEEPVEPEPELNGIAILVDESTISQPEFSVLAWRELPNSVVIGSTTAGAIGNLRTVPLPDNMFALFTGLRVLDNEGKDVQYEGIVPDIYIKPSIPDIQSERDVVIDKAIEVLKEL